MAPASTRTWVIVAGATIAILFLVVSLMNHSDEVAGLKNRVEKMSQSNVVSFESHPGAPASAPSYASAEFAQKLGSGKMDALDNELLKNLREKWIYAPSKLPYNLARPDRGSWDQIGQTKLVDATLKQRRNGFYVETGGYNGEDHSNTLFFEKSRDWEGLLVEPDPFNFEGLLSKNRKAYIVNGGISMGSSPVRADFTFAGGLGGISDASYNIKPGERQSIQGRGRVQCFPIRSLLAALGRTHVDYYSLDVEGAEIDILRSFPWEHITVDVWTIEYAVHGGGGATPVREKAIRDIFKQTGLYGEGRILGSQDIVFVRKDVK